MKPENESFGEAFAFEPRGKRAEAPPPKKREERVCILCGRLLKLRTKPTDKGRLICTRRRCMRQRMEDNE